MNVSVNLNGDSYVLGAAVLLYKHSTHSYDSTAPQAIATVHTVSDDGGAKVIDAGRPMTEQDYQNMLGVLAPKSRPQMEWLEDCVLARGMGRMIWWTPPMTRAMFFQESSMYGGTFEGRGVCPVPAMVWHATERHLYVYAFDGDARPGRNMRLSQAPLFNVWSDGKVCVGNAALPREDQRSDPKAWERFLFGSHFSHPNFSEKDRLTKGIDPIKFWRGMVKKPSKVFPSSRLVPLKITVGDLMEHDYMSRVSARARGEF